MELARKLWSGEEGQDIAEYAVMLAVILVIVVGTIRLMAPTRITCSPTSPVPFSSATRPLREASKSFSS